MIDVTPGSEDRRRAFLIAWAVLSAFLIMTCTVNALSTLHDSPDVEPVEPFIWEYSSGLLGIALMPAIGWLVRRVPPERDRWWRFVSIHAAASVAYSLVHVGGFQLIRVGVYSLVGARYGPPEWLYEYRKDLVSYALFAAVLWTADWIARNRSGAAGAAEVAGPRLYALRDGARTVRVPFEEIVAVTSARNYVEFHLADGAKPLVRDTLTKVETDLIAAGFLRTHRSWLVNPAHVRTVAPAAGGDFRLELAGGVTAPLSRRFPEALEALRRAA